MKKLFAFLLCLVVFLPTLIYAADFRTDSVSGGENVRNLYVTGQNVSVDANVGGDVTAAGNNVNINGNVEKGLQVAGSNINVKGSVGDTARIAGGTINVDGNVGEDLVVFGGQVTVGNNSTISHDIVIMGGNVIINGNVNGKIVGSVGNFTLNGRVSGDVDLNQVQKITLGSNAAINGKLKYSSTNKSEFNESQVRGGVEFTQINKADVKKNANKFLLGFSILGLIGSFLLLYLLVRLAPKAATAFLVLSFASPWANIGIGFITLVVVPVALFLLLISIIGMPIAGLGLLIYILLLALAGILASLIIGSWIVKAVSRREEYPINWIAVLVGVIAVLVLKFIPVLGWIVVFLLFLWALGSLTRMFYSNMLLQRK